MSVQLTEAEREALDRLTTPLTPNLRAAIRLQVEAILAARLAAADREPR